MKYLIPIFLVIFSLNMPEKTYAQVSFGVFADCQYCDCDPAINRYYRKAADRLENCIAQFNQNDQLEFVAGLGDLIDHGFESYERVNSILAKSNKTVFNVAGNHDFEVEKEKLENVPGKLGLSKTYYSFAKKDWYFIFLNGNEITLNSNDPEIVEQAKKMLHHLKEENKPNVNEWNGGIGNEQLKWLGNELRKAEKQNRKVVIFCHYPILPLEAHSLWNSGEVLKILSIHKNVKLWLNGHNHAGNYASQNGIYFVNLHGMVQTENQNAFAEVTLSDDAIEIKGFGREPDRNLKLK